MTSKHWTLVGGAVACLASILEIGSASASPWVEPGDAYERFRMQYYADRGLLDATVSSWPLSRSNAKLVKESESDRFLWNEVGGKIGTAVHLTLGGATSPDMIGGFGDSPNEQGEVDFTLDYVGDAFAIALSPSYAPDPSDDETVRFDGSYVAGTLSNWTFGAGYIDRWWGPGWQSSLILSDNARPLPTVWFNRRNTHTAASPWLSWLGPWNFTAFAGQFEKERAIPDAKLVGMRLNFRPLTGLEIGLSRLIQWGGEGQPESLSSFWDSFRGNDNFGSNGADPGNQLAGIDLRYGFAFNDHTVGLYTQVVGEDEAGYLPSRKVYQFGIDWTSQWFGGNQQWYLEGVDTLTEGVFGSERRPNYAYEHFNYRSGMRHLGRNIATTFDADSRAITLGTYHFSNADRLWQFALTYAELNRDGGSRFVKGGGDDVDYFVPLGSKEVLVADLRHERPLPIGDLMIGLSIASDAIEVAGDSVDEVMGAIEWRVPL